MDNEALMERIQKGEEQISGLTKSLDTLRDVLKTTPAAGLSNPNQVFGGFGAPNVRRGENIMGSRGYSFMKQIGAITGAIPPEDAKIELDIADRLEQCYIRNPQKGGGEGYEWGGKGSRFLAPLATSYFADDMVSPEFRTEMKSLVNAGMSGADQEEMSWIRKKQLNAMGYGSKALSWLNELTGGAIVAPPEMGELIELLRNKEALVNAGARVVPLPPQGRMKYPKQTASSLAFWVGENSPLTESIVGTGEITLQAKKLAVLIKAPNELIRFASPAAEALLRDDMTKTLALGLDLAGLEGTGTDTRPRGILNYPNINRVNSTAQTSNGDKVVGQDVYRMIAAIEESNAECESFIMRPKTLYKYYQLRADAVAQGDSSGPFLFSLIREATDGAPATIAGYPVVKSTQVSQARSKGTASNLTYVLAGMFSDILIGMFGAIEFAATTMGDTAFTQDQTWVRGILSADIQLRHESAFCLIDNIDTTLL